MSNIFDLFKKIEKPSVPSSPITHIIVGLGNPGDKYAFTRHNIGFMAVDHLCDTLNVKCNKIKFSALVCDATIGDKHVLIMKPQTFMNNSGEAIIQAVDFYKIAPENLIIFSDDISLDVGKLRIRRSGSAGGHNGLKSIIEHLKADTFPRVKLGVGQKPSPEYDLADWVLSRFPKENEKSINGVLGVVPDIISIILDGKIDDAMSKYNGFQAEK